MSLIVQKFGGSSVANAERVMNVAKIVTDTYKKGNSVVVVVSAQGDTTDDLIEKANEINPNASKRERDMLLAAGEQMSIALLAMAIEKLGYPVVSLLGWQAGFETSSAYTSARIKRVNTDRIMKELDKNNIVVVAGFKDLIVIMMLQHLVVVVLIQVQLLLQQQHTQTFARYSQMLRAFIQPTQERSKTQRSSIQFLMMKCLSLQLSAHRF